MSINCMRLCGEADHMALYSCKITLAWSSLHLQDVLLDKCMYLPWKLMERRRKIRLLCAQGQLVPPGILSRVQLRSPVSPLLLSGLSERKMKRSFENELKFYKHKPNIFIR